MPFALLPDSPLLPGVAPVRIHYREFGSGRPLIFLHGGWGYEVYPFDRQIKAFADRCRIIIPDRSGYGASMRIERQSTDFHRGAAIETRALLDELRIERPILWGHSDGAVISIFMALNEPYRFPGLILEAFHYYRVKEGSREFFERMAQDPDGLGQRTSTTLAREHGSDYWKHLIVINGEAWLGINSESSHSKDDLYGGCLREIKPPLLFIHGDRDPRTEPDELDAIRRELPGATIRIIENGGHSPHSESAAADETIAAAAQFLDKLPV